MSFGSMEASAWLLLLSIPTLVVALFLHRRQSQFRGIGMFGASCPRCAAPLPSVRKTTSIREVLWGGWTCNKCGCKATGTVGRERLVIEPRCPLSPPGARNRDCYRERARQDMRRTAICKRIRSPPYPALTLRLTFLPPVTSRLID
jgi:hypothetical protein